MAVRVMAYRVPYVSTQATPKLCKDCKHYIRPEKNGDLRLGRCAKFGMIHLVDGTVDYDMASNARENKCRGDMYEIRPDAADNFDKETI
jgi:hypothetical protein